MSLFDAFLSPWSIQAQIIDLVMEMFNVSHVDLYIMCQFVSFSLTRFRCDWDVSLLEGVADSEAEAVAFQLRACGCFRWSQCI